VRARLKKSQKKNVVGLNFSQISFESLVGGQKKRKDHEMQNRKTWRGTSYKGPEGKTRGENDAYWSGYGERPRKRGWYGRHRRFGGLATREEGAFVLN